MNISVISMIKSPHNFATWLKYHKIFVSNFYFIFDHKLDSDEFGVLRKMAESYLQGRNVMVHSTFQYFTPSKKAGTTKYTEIIHKQVLCVNAVIKTTPKKNGLLFFIDDDELLYIPKNHYVAENFVLGWIQNLEGRIQRNDIDGTNIFKNSTLFETDKNRFHAYNNGKPVMNTLYKDHIQLHPTGPHRFIVKYPILKKPEYTYHSLERPGKNEPIPIHDACILHCDSTTFKKWIEKFQFAIEEPVAMTDFAFYNESIAHAVSLKACLKGRFDYICSESGPFCCNELAKAYFINKKVRALPSMTIISRDELFPARILQD